MKKLFMLISLILIFSAPNCLSQQPKVKFGEVSEDDLKMTVYDKDPEASAVVLYEEKDTRYDYNSFTGIVVKNRYFVRIKILTNDGLEYADHAIAYYIGKTRAESEYITGLSGNTYNLVNGKIEKTKLSKENIFEEKVSERITRTKFAFPAVQPGSIIEYKYELTSPRDGDLDDYVFQRSIPVKYSKYELYIPEYYSFSKETKGYEPIKIVQDKTNQSFLIGSNQLNFTADKYLFEVSDLPGLKKENYVWCMNDFMTRVTFELRSFTIPGVVYKDFINSWENVDKQLLEYSNFGKQFNHKLFKEEFATLLTPEMSEPEKISKIYHLVRSKVKWNDENTLSANNPKDALKKGIGTSGEINALLISALREAGFEAYPVVMSLRNRGRIPVSHPTIDYLNYYIVAVDVEGKPIYMDASAKYGDLNVLPPVTMCDFARSVKGNRSSGWVNLTNITKSTEIAAVSLHFNEEGVLAGTYNQNQSGELGYSFRNNYYGHKDQQDYIEKQESANNISISDFEIKGADHAASKATFGFKFTKNDVTLGGDHIYFNPLIFPIFKENPFKSEKRQLPVEFSYPYEQRINVNIKVPDGYSVEALPDPGKISLNEKEASFTYLIEHNKEANMINLNIRYNLNKILYSPLEYEHLREFFSYITTSNTNQLVLKKVSE